MRTCGALWAWQHHELWSGLVFDGWLFEDCQNEMMRLYNRARHEDARRASG